MGKHINILKRYTWTFPKSSDSKRIFVFKNKSLNILNILVSDLSKYEEEMLGNLEQVIEYFRTWLFLFLQVSFVFFKNVVPYKDIRLLNILEFQIHVVFRIALIIVKYEGNSDNCESALFYDIYTRNIKKVIKIKYETVINHMAHYISKMLNAISILFCKNLFLKYDNKLKLWFSFWWSKLK